MIMIKLYQVYKRQDTLIFLQKKYNKSFLYVGSVHFQWSLQLPYLIRFLLPMLQRHYGRNINYKRNRKTLSPLCAYYIDV